MKMKMKRHEVMGLNSILSIEGFSTSEMNDENSFNIVLLKSESAKVSEAAEKIRTDFVKTNKTKEFETLSNKEEKKLTEEEKIKLHDLNIALNEKFVDVYTKYVEEEIEVEFDKFDKSEFKKLMLSNKDNKKLDVNKFSYLSKYFIKEETEGEK